LNVEELTALLGGWEGYVLGTVGRVEPVGEQGHFKPEIWLELRPLAERRKCCSGCGQGWIKSMISRSDGFASCRLWEPRRGCARGFGHPSVQFILPGAMPPNDENVRFVCAEAKNQSKGPWESTVKACTLPRRLSGPDREALWRPRLRGW
jgi:hypothetical protein